MLTKKSKLAGALAVVLTIGVLTMGTGLLASENANVNGKQLNHKVGTQEHIDHKDAQHKDHQGIDHKDAQHKDHQGIDHKNKQHKNAKCDSHQNDNHKNK
jgi:hypothetical protein